MSKNIRFRRRRVPTKISRSTVNAMLQTDHRLAVQLAVTLAHSPLSLVEEDEAGVADAGPVLRGEVPVSPPAVAGGAVGHAVCATATGPAS